MDEIVRCPNVFDIFDIFDPEDVWLLIDQVGRPELTFGNVGTFGCESLEPVDVGMFDSENGRNENKE
jgi:Ni,Fe-hydrogenase I small subunit